MKTKINNIVKNISSPSLVKFNEFIPFVNSIIKYINFISNDYACSTTILRDGIFLLADFCDSYLADIKPLLDKILIQKMVTQIENDKSEEIEIITKTGLDWAKKTIDKIFQN